MAKKDIIKEGKLNEVITIVTPRSNNSIRIQQDFEFCPTMTEQHSAHLTDINYLIEKYTPDELTAYIIARAGNRQAVSGRDLSQEPDYMEAKNRVYKMKQVYNDLKPDLKNMFRTPLEFYKFLDDPANMDKLIKLGHITPEQKSEINDESKTTTKTDSVQE